MLTRVLGKISASKCLYRLTGRRELGRSAGQQTHMFSHAGITFLDIKPIPRTKTTLHQETKRRKNPARSHLYLLKPQKMISLNQFKKPKPLGSESNKKNLEKSKKNETITERMPSERSGDSSQCSGKEIHCPLSPK